MASRSSSDPFAPLIAALTDLPRQHPGLRRALIGLSGGVDSTALLLAAVETLRGVWEVEALHVNHGLHADAGQWEGQCRDHCERLGVHLIVEQVTVEVSGQGPEADARTARYAAFERTVNSETALLLAHHRDDQAETFILRAIRGSGPDGLGSMKSQRSLGEGLLLRPLLGLPRSLLAERVRASGLTPVDDPMNADLALERARVRHRVLPELQRKRPGATTALARAASLCGEAGEVGEWFARREIAARAGSIPSMLSLVKFGAMPGAVQRQILRTWLRDRRVPLPPRVRLSEFLRQLAAPNDAGVALNLGRIVLRRYGEALFITSALTPPPADVRLEWSGPGIDLPAGCGRLEWQRPESSAAVDPGMSLTVGFRRGGERLPCYPEGSHRSLKSLFQERRIPPWERYGIPLIERAGKLVAVPGVWEHPAWRREIDQLGCEPVWLSRAPGF